MMIKFDDKYPKNQFLKFNSMTLLFLRLFRHDKAFFFYENHFSFLKSNLIFCFQDKICLIQQISKVNHPNRYRLN